MKNLKRTEILRDVSFEVRFSELATAEPRLCSALFCSPSAVFKLLFRKPLTETLNHFSSIHKIS